MKKFFAVVLALTLALSLCACGEKPQETTAAPETTPVEAVPETTAAPIQETGAPAVNDREYTLTFNGVELIPGADYDASLLPEPGYTYEVPSCAFEGTDNVYSFDTVEITAFHDGNKEIIYAIAILDPNVCTDEGLYIGDDAARVIELYGEAYEENGTAMVYTGRNTMLTIIVQNGLVVDIEFSWIAK